MGSVSYRKVGNRWHIRFQEHGRETIESLSGSLKEKTVRRKAGWYREQWELGRYNPFEEEQQMPDLNLEDATRLYLQSKWRAGDWNATSYQVYKNMLDTLQQVIGPHRRLSYIDDWGKFIRRDLSPGAKRTYQKQLNGFLSWLHEQGYIEETRVRQAIQPPQRRIKYITYRELQKVSEATKQIDRQIRDKYRVSDTPKCRYMVDIWWFMFWQMLRISELIGNKTRPPLRHKDIRIENKTMRVHGKGGRVDWIYIVPPALKIAKKYHNPDTPDEALFGVKTHSHLYTKWQRSVRRAFPNKPTGFHQLRHGGAVHYFSLGKPVQFVSKLLRHADVGVTYEVYGDVIPEAVEEAFSDVEDKPAVSGETKENRGFKENIRKEETSER